MQLLKTDVGRFRIVSLLEGLSYVVLLGIAMPLKYLAHDPSGVRLVGRVHGFLFVIFVMALARATSEAGWSGRRAAQAFGLSLVPFGAFVLERRLGQEVAARIDSDPA